MTTVQTTDFSTKDRTLTLPVDAEHSGLRMVGCSSFVVSVVVALVLMNTLLPDAIVLNLLLSLGGGALIAFGLEQILRRRWPSGRKLVVNDDVIALVKDGKIETQVDPQAYTNVLAWHFVVKRNSRVRKGWYVIGFALEQDGKTIPVYTFAPPETFDNMPLASHFKKLVDPRKQKDDTQSLRRAGDQRRLYEAERLRGMDGAEITFDQFQILMTHLQQHFPKWMMTTS